VSKWAWQALFLSLGGATSMGQIKHSNARRKLTQFAAAYTSVVWSEYWRVDGLAGCADVAVLADRLNSFRYRMSTMTSTVEPFIVDSAASPT
jgi:hypothetical protein